jgi:hypothetical protein
MRCKVFTLNSKAVFIFVFTICVGATWAEDEESIKGLRDALVALAPTVDPAEAQLLSMTTHTMSRSLAREYGVTGDPAVHNFLINIGERKRGYCAHYARDIGSRLRELQFKTLVLHWGAAYAKEADESNCLVITARNQPFQDGIILDAWRHAGRLFWCPVRKDREYEIGHRFALNRLGARPPSGVTAWKEDLQETAWLQYSPPSKPKPKRVASLRKHGKRRRSG